MTRARLVLAISFFTGLTLLVAYLFRDDIFSTLKDPGQPFQTMPKPPRPDYSETSAWMTRPALDVDPVTLQAKGDVFVVVPEVYTGEDSWNLPTEDPVRVEKLRRIVEPNYVEPYRDAGRLFAPLYRQAALYAFLNQREDSQKAQDLAYQDVRRAFTSFLAANPPERPIVLVGHGQGAAHAQRLLSDFGERIRDKLAVAYIIDHPFPLQRLGTLPACENETQTGCVIAWTAYMDGERTRPTRLRERTLVWDGNGYAPVGGKPLLCVNPLTWSSDDTLAPADLHKGGVSAVGFEPGLRPTVHREQVKAQCVDGLLDVSLPPIRSLRRPRKLGGKFRTLPSNLFYQDLRENAVLRVESLIDAGTLPRRAAPLGDLETVEDVPVVTIGD